MNLIGVFLYRKNYPVILRSEYLVRLSKDCCPICSCPTSQNMGLACDANVDVLYDWTIICEGIIRYFVKY